MQNSVMFLQEYDISIGFSGKIFKKFGPDSAAKIKKNPYILCEVDEQMHTMQMTASDGEVYLSDIVGLNKCEGGGRFCVPAKHLSAALDGLPLQRQRATTCSP